ncbi:hypothetical protein ACGFIF_40405 [Kribbella sp. NPDC049174]|uniref:hypothetical protein n=1 Tax=Kribbella sp. NPDC049174 TaxID=3364112 RepID=UPI0037182B66
MRIVGAASEAEMVASFLVGELASERFGSTLALVLARSGHSTTLLTNANLSDPQENEQRRQLLGEFRGYRQNRELFEGFPDNVSWQHVLLSPSELLSVRYIDYSYWTALTAGTRRPTDAARFIRRGGLVFGRMPTGHFLTAAESLQAGLTCEPMMCVRSGAGRPLVVFEGHARLTAMALATECLPDEVPILLGTAAAISDWPCY